ncbi:MAG: hypothetical protein ABEI11_03260 [Haloarculaceae archaeon]
MTDDDRGSTDEHTVQREPGVTADPDADSDPDPDAVADSFLDLEAELDRDRAAEDRPGRTRGLIVDAERIPAEAVPADYPATIEGERPLALTVELPGATRTTVYLPWDAGEGPSVEWLLDAMGVDFADLYGRRLPLRRREGAYVPVLPAERPRGSGDWALGIVGSHLLSVLALGAVVTVPGAPLWLLGLWLAATLLAAPYATYRDAWYLRTHSDWTGGPLFWATLSTLPLGNLLVGGVYLRQRARARFLGDEPSLLARAARAVRSWL